MAGPLLLLFLLASLQLFCTKAAERDKAYEELRSCVTVYWQTRAGGKLWTKDRSGCCASVEVAGQEGRPKRQDPIARDIVIQRFELRQIELGEDLRRAEVRVWLEYTVPLIPTTLTKEITEVWERKGGVWCRKPSNLNAVLVGAGRGS